MTQLVESSPSVQEAFDLIVVSEQKYNETKTPETTP